MAFELEELSLEDGTLETEIPGVERDTFTRRHRNAFGSVVPRDRPVKTVGESSLPQLSSKNIIL